MNASKSNLALQVVLLCIGGLGCFYHEFELRLLRKFPFSKSPQ